LIANIQNGEGYSKLKQIVKKSVKAILSDNKKLISVSFAALIQTLKANPQMVKLIQNIASANDGGEQHKENNNNAIRYLEFHKNSLSDLIEKHYENLVEALTNDSISSAAVFSSNPTISLPSPSSSSSTFSAPPDQSDIYGIEKSESFHNNKGDSDG
jgi:F0F1-type ATP synthase gamma subunit